MTGRRRFRMAAEYLKLINQDEELHPMMTQDELDWCHLLEARFWEITNRKYPEGDRS